MASLDGAVLRPLTCGANGAKSAAAPMGEPHELFNAVCELESSSYPADEAASPAKLLLRAREAYDFFWTLCGPGDVLIGFVCGTLSESDSLDAASMSTHSPLGTHLCIHSVVVQPSHRAQGVATLMLRRYIAAIGYERPDIASMHLLSHSDHCSLYARVGFVGASTSTVIHGSSPWIAMRRSMTPADGRPQLYLIDAFTASTRPFSGNPACVVFLPSPACLASVVDVFPPTAVLQGIAAEVASPGTAFLRPLIDGSMAIRWFTPTAELTLCGHATLAAAHAAWAHGITLNESQLVLRSASGDLNLKRQHEEYTLDFPASTPIPDAATSVAAIAEAIGVTDLPADSVRALRAGPDLILHVPWPVFAAVNPNRDALLALNARIITVTTRGGDAGVITATAPARCNLPAYDFDRAAYDIVSRCFAPRSAAGVEDAVCGAAHCELAPYWLRVAVEAGFTGKSTLKAFQASQRGGELHLTLVEPLDGPARVLLRGSARTFVDAHLEKGVL